MRTATASTRHGRIRTWWAGALVAAMVVVMSPTARVTPVSAAAATVDVMLLLDGSGSIDSSDWALQREGYAAALSDRTAFPVDGSVAVGVLQWSGTTRLEVPLTTLDSEAKAQQLASKLLSLIQIGGSTNPGDGVREGTDHLIASGRSGADRTLCMSTDGSQNSGEDLGTAVAFAKSASVDRYSVVAIEDGGFDADAARAAYGPHVFGGGTVAVARNTTDFTSLITGSCRGQALELVGLEVNQAVQDWAGSVSLIADKPTVVRAFVQTPPGVAETVTTARLHGRRAQLGTPQMQTLSLSPLAPLNPASTVRVKGAVADRRGDANASFNFRLPPDWLSDGLPIELTLELPGGAICREPDDDPNTCSTIVSFISRPDAHLRVVEVPYKADGTTKTLSYSELVEQGRRIASILPVPSVDAEARTYNKTYSKAPSEEDVVDDLLTARKIDGSDELYVGALRGGENGGLASGIPGKAAMGYLDDLTGVDDEGHARNRLPHEVAHALGVQHAVNAADNGYKTRFFGLDNVAKRGYCNEVGDENTTDYPYVSTIDGQKRPVLGPIGTASSEIWGADPRYLGRSDSLFITDPRTTFSLMSYCEALESGQGRWVDKSTYEQLIDLVDSGSIIVPRIAAASTAGLSVDALLVRGRIDWSSPTPKAMFEPFLSTPTPGAPLAPGPFTLELRDASGTTLRSVPFTPDIADADPAAPNTEAATPVGLFHIAITDPPQFASAVVVYGGAVVGAVTASASAPTVAVTQPPTGTVGPDGVAVAWAAADTDGDPLTTTVQYSADDGTTWRTVALDIVGSSVVVPRSQVPGSDVGRFRITVTDGVRVTSVISVPIAFPDLAPELAIVAPTDGALFSGVQAVFLEAEARDPEHGALDNDAIQWTSDRDGLLGTGSTIVVDASTLSVGTHHLTATATDVAGSTSTATRSISIVRVAAPPIDNGPPCTENLTGDVTGPFTVSDGQHLCIVGARVVGPLDVAPGGALTVLGSQVSRGIHTTGARFVKLCDTAVAADGVRIEDSSGRVVIGDPANACLGNRILGVTLDGNRAGVTLAGNHIFGNTSVTDNSGGQVIVSQNTIDNGFLACSANDPPPDAKGQPNVASGGMTGQCAGGPTSTSSSTSSSTSTSSTSTTTTIPATTSTSTSSTSSTTTTIADPGDARCAALRQQLNGVAEPFAAMLLAAAGCPPG